MAQFIIDIDQPDLDRVRAAIAKNFNRKDKVTNPSFDPGRPENPGNNPREIDNPEHVDDFINRMMREFIIEHVRVAETREARSQAANNVPENVDVRRGN